MVAMRQTLDRLSTSLLRYLLPATALLLPIFFLPITTDFFLTNKNLLLLIVGSLSLLAWSVRNITRRRILVSATPATLSLLFLAIVYVLSALLQSGNSYMSLMGRTALVVALTALYTGVTSSQKNQVVINLTFGALILSAVLASFFSLYSYLGLSASLDAPAWLTNKAFNPTGGPVPFLTFIFPLLPVTLYLAFKSNRWQLKAVLLLSTALLAGASLSQISLILPGSGNTIFVLPFTAGWSIALDIFKNWRTAALGVGPENFLAAFTRLKPAYLNLTPLWDSRFSSSSNELFSVLTTTGVLGAALWLSLFLKTGNLALKQITGKKSTTNVIASFLLLLGFFIANLIVPANPVLLGLSVVGLALVNLSLKLDTNEVKDVAISLAATSGVGGAYDQLSESKSSQNALLPWFSALVFVLLLAFFWYFEGRAYIANLATFKALSSLKTNATESYNQQILAYNLEPNNPYYRLNFSQTSLALANSIATKKDITDQDKSNVTALVQQAIREAKKASELDPDNVLTWENLGSTYRQLINFAQGAQDWAVASYGQAMVIDPNNARLRLELGGIFFTVKDYDSAQKLYEQAVNLKPNWANAHYNLSVLFKTKKEYAKALAEIRVVVQLLDPNGKDYQQAQNELKELEKLAPAATQTDNKQGGELTTPTPPPSPNTKVDLPTDSAPSLPK